MNTIHMYSKPQIILLFAFIGLVGLFSCNKQKSRNYQQSTIDTVNYGNNEIKVEKEIISSIDEKAIGNIHMNTSESQFEAEKKIFLNEHPKLGGLTIKSINGFFYDNRLAAIEIISEQQKIHKKLIRQDYSFDEGWHSMYRSKYPRPDFKELGIIHPFSFEKMVAGLSIYKKDNFLIEVSDVCDSPNKHFSFADIINTPKKECYGHNLRPLKFDDSNNLMRAGSVLALIGELPSGRAKYYESQYKLEKDRICTDNMMVRISMENAIDRKYFNLLLPEVQAQRERLLNIHRNDPSWSFIIIYYKPLLNKYKSDQELLKRKKSQDKEKELDII